jgi:hypothetical protein
MIFFLLSFFDGILLNVIQRKREEASLEKKNSTKIDSSEAKRKNSTVSGDATEGERSLPSSRGSRSSTIKNALKQDVKKSSFWRDYYPSCGQDHNNLMTNTCFVALNSIDMSLKSGQSNEDSSITFSDEDGVSILDDGDWRAEKSECIGSTDCIHVKWDRCPVELTNLCKGKEGYPIMSHLPNDFALPPRKRKTMDDAYFIHYLLKGF